MKKQLGLAAVLGIIGLAFFCVPAEQVVHGGPVNAADTAWILTATALVLLMTPGLSFFYGGMVRREERGVHASAELHRDGGDQPAVGRGGVQPQLR